MKNEELEKVSGYVKKHRLQKRWQKVVTCLAAVVVFCTTYALILPAITLENDLVLDCSCEVHQHESSCFDADGNVICGYADYVVHTHNADCYDLEGNLLCPLDEVEAHEHDDSCYEKQVILVCGLTESDGTHQHSEECYENQSVLTCEKPEVILHVHSDDCYDKEGNLICGKLQVLEHTHDEGCFVSANFDENEQENIEENVTEVPETSAPPPEMQTAAVAGEKEFLYENDQFLISFRLEGTVNLPIDEQLPADDEESTEYSDGSAGETTADMETQNQSIEGAAFSEAPEENSQISEDISAEQSKSELLNAAEVSWDDIDMDAMPLETDNETYQQLLYFAQEQGGTDELLSLLALQFRFSCDGLLLDVSDCTLTASITSKATAYSEADVFQEEAAPEAEVGVVFSALSAEDQQISELDSVLVTAEDDATPAMTLSLEANGILALAASETANPQFTVQYYAYVDQVSASGSNPLTVINTDNGGNGTGGNLPTNGTTPATKNLYLTLSDGDYILATNKNTVVPVYSAKEYEYIQAPNLTYFNRLYENGHYKLKEVWILNNGKSSESTNKDDWTVYSDLANLHFTNRQQSATDGTILITDSTVIRLVFNTTTGDYKNTATFYDYDITDGNFYKSASLTGGTYSTQAEAGSSTVYAYTNQQGINSSGNYSGTEAKLAFGNNNTATGLGTVTWSGNSLNKYNDNGYQGCTFGLVTGLDESGHIQYASGVVAPSLFNESTATGKTAFADQSLTFIRDGDTYTLSAVSGSAANVSGLNQFTHITSYGSGIDCNLFTNLFWPMDTASTFGAAGHDLMFGQYKIRTQRKYFGNATKSFPTVDENITNDVDHNSYFGMQYAVQFTLTDDYIGPLEYYFFGDDDMWVFLDGKLVCDIGGVHSSVGEYVNLWDYIQKGVAGTHTLSFFYTERGASGSSCYMRFTLPSVSSITPEQNTGTLLVEKEVVGPNASDKEFTFLIHFTDSSGNNLKDDYSYTRYTRDGTVIKTDVIIYDGGTFQLKDGEYIIVKYLPAGAKYCVTETNPDPDVYLTTISTNNGTPVSGRTAKGTIQLITEEKVHYVNETHHELPETGGAGTVPYTVGGLLLLTGAATLLLYKHKRRRKEAFTSS